MIEFENVSMTYFDEETPTVDNINIKIDSGEFVFVVGKSGAGKSTLLKMFLREITPTGGKIFIDDEDISKIKQRKLPYYRRKVGVVFQNYRLLETKTVYENVAFAMEAVNARMKDINRSVPKVLKLVGLDRMSMKYPSKLSGGEQQRVAIARSIINKPDILICDEPTGNLDPHTSTEIMNLLSAINKSGTTIIIATHDITMVDKMNKRVISLEDGRISSDKIGGYYN